MTTDKRTIQFNNAQAIIYSAAKLGLSYSIMADSIQSKYSFTEQQWADLLKLYETNLNTI